MNVLITGGYGFIGSCVAERLNKEGHSIFIVDNLSNNARTKLDIEHKFYNFNIEDEKCEEIFRVYNIDVVLHFAVKQVKTYADQKGNMLGLVNILSLCKKYEVKQAIFSFSAWFFDGNGAKMHAFFGEKQNLKVDIEQYYQVSAINYCKKIKELYGSNIVLVFLTNVYGDWQTKGVFSVWTKNLFEKKPLRISGDGKQTRDFVNVADVTDVFVRIIQRGYDKQPLLVSSNKETTLNECLALFKKDAKDAVVIYDKENVDDVKRVVVEDFYCEKELGWRPKYSIEEGIEKLLVHYKKELEKNSQ